MLNSRKIMWNAVSVVGSVISRLAVAAMLCGTSGCVSALFPQDTACVQTASDRPRQGNVYLIRGWSGLFSWGIDDLAKDLNDAGVRAYVFRHEQHEELTKTLVEKYRGVKDPEPLCLVAHSAGSDDTILIARELEAAGVKVNLIVTLDCVDQSVVPKNVDVCYNFWAPKEDTSSNFLRGMPFQQEPGSTGKLYNVNLHEDGKELCKPGANHLTLDKDTTLRRTILEKVLEACPERLTQTAGK